MSMTNGTIPRRKQLSEEIDRLDGILDGLSEALEESVAEAVKTAVGEAVRQSISETIAATIGEITRNPGLLQGLREMLTPASQPAPTTSEQKEEPPKKQRSWLGRQMDSLGNAASSSWKWLGNARSGLGDCLKTLWEHRTPLLTLSGIGGAVGAGSFLLGPVVSAILAGVGGSLLALVIVTLLSVRSMLTGPLPMDALLNEYQT